MPVNTQLWSRQIWGKHMLRLPHHHKLRIIKSKGYFCGNKQCFQDKPLLLSQFNRRHYEVWECDICCTFLSTILNKDNYDMNNMTWTLLVMLMLTTTFYHNHTCLCWALTVGGYGGGARGVGPGGLVPGGVGPGGFGIGGLGAGMKIKKSNRKFFCFSSVCQHTAALRSSCHYP